MTAAEIDLRNHIACELFIKNASPCKDSFSYALDASVAYRMADSFIATMREEMAKIEEQQQETARQEAEKLKAYRDDLRKLHEVMADPTIGIDHNIGVYDIGLNPVDFKQNGTAPDSVDPVTHDMIAKLYKSF